MKNPGKATGPHKLYPWAGHPLSLTFPPTTVKHPAVLLHKSTGCTSKRDAEKWEAAYKTALAMGNVGVTQKKKAPLLKDFATDVFLPNVRIEHVTKPRTVAYYEQSMGRLTYCAKKEEGKPSLPDSPWRLNGWTNSGMRTT